MKPKFILEAQSNQQGEEQVDPVQTAMNVAAYAGHIVVATQKFHAVADGLKVSPTAENTEKAQLAMAKLLGAVSECNEQLAQMIKHYGLPGLATK